MALRGLPDLSGQLPAEELLADAADATSVVLATQVRP